MDDEKSQLGKDEISEQPDAPPESQSSEEQQKATQNTPSQDENIVMPEMDMAQPKAVGQEEENTSPPDAVPLDEQAPQAKSADQVQDTANPEDWNENDAEAAMLKMMGEKDLGEPKPEADDATESVGLDSQPVVEPAAFKHLQPTPAEGQKNLKMLMDVALPIAIELGRTSMAIEDILNLGPGSVVELDKLAGEPVDLLINNKLLAKGEVVVIDENFGVRITNMVSPKERIKSLK